MQTGKKANQVKKLTWYEPRWSYRPRARAELATILSVRLWLRILIWVVLITSLLAYGVKHMIPDLEFNWYGALAASIGILALYMSLMTLLIWYISPIVRVTTKGISRQQGNSVHWLLSSDITHITILLTDPSRPLLQIETMNRKPWACGISAQVDIENLIQFLRATYLGALVEEKR